MQGAAAAGDDGAEARPQEETVAEVSDAPAALPEDPARDGFADAEEVAFVQDRAPAPKPSIDPQRPRADPASTPRSTPKRPNVDPKSPPKRPRIDPESPPPSRHLHPARARPQFDPSRDRPQIHQTWPDLVDIVARMSVPRRLWRMSCQLRLTSHQI